MKTNFERERDELIEELTLNMKRLSAEECEALSNREVSLCELASFVISQKIVCDITEREYEDSTSKTFVEIYMINDYVFNMSYMRDVEYDSVITFECESFISALNDISRIMTR